MINRYDDEILESDAASSSVSVSVSESNAKTYNRTVDDGYPPICRPKSAKKGPNTFAQLRIVQELNREHTGERPIMSKCTRTKSMVMQTNAYVCQTL